MAYVQTAFGTQFRSIEAERAALLALPGTIAQEPWVEILPRYETIGKRMRDLTTSDVPQLSPGELTDFKDLAQSGLFKSENVIYRHQLEMLNRALDGGDCVVTAGTGSGKTESFLLPLFAYLVKESRSWTAPAPTTAHQSDWWRDEAWRASCYTPHGRGMRMQQSLRVDQRANETRPAAVRALVVYPMNALVEDQLSRMRRALDSVEARRWATTRRGNNLIYFGRYNGSTPVPGHEFEPPNARGVAAPDRDRIEELAERLSESEVAARIAAEHAATTGDPDVVSFFPRLDGARCDRAGTCKIIRRTSSLRTSAC